MYIHTYIYTHSIHCIDLYISYTGTFIDIVCIAACILYVWYVYSMCMLCVCYVYAMCTKLKKQTSSKTRLDISLCIPPAHFGHSFLYIPASGVLKVYSGDTYSRSTGDCMGETRVPLQWYTPSEFFMKYSGYYILSDK